MATFCSIKEKSILRDEELENLVVDSSNIEVKRRKRRAKTDRMDVRKLLKKLIRQRSGEQDVWSLGNVPSVEEEDRRHLHLVFWKSTIWVARS